MNNSLIYNHTTIGKFPKSNAQIIDLEKKIHRLNQEVLELEKEINGDKIEIINEDMFHESAKNKDNKLNEEKMDMKEDSSEDHWQKLKYRNSKIGNNIFYTIVINIFIYLSKQKESFLKRFG